MQVNRFGYYFIFGLFFILACASKPLFMPEELVNFARKNSCKQISDFFVNKPGMLNPPYTYGYSEGSEEDGAVLWCKGKDDKKTYLLTYLKENSNGSLTRCDKKISWSDSPRGLSVVKNSKLDLSLFFYLKDPMKNGPKNIETTHPVILSAYDGVETYFYCHEGEWLVRQLH